MYDRGVSTERVLTIYVYSKTSKYKPINFHDRKSTFYIRYNRIVWHCHVNEIHHHYIFVSLKYLCHAICTFGNNKENKAKTMNIRLGGFLSYGLNLLENVGAKEKKPCEFCNKFRYYE